MSSWKRFLQRKSRGEERSGGSVLHSAGTVQPTADELPDAPVGATTQEPVSASIGQSVAECSDINAGNTYGNIYASGHASLVLGNIHQVIQPIVSDEEQECHRAFKTSSYEEDKDRNPSRIPDTCQWALNHPNFRNWHDTQKHAILWISADPGCGKSVLAKALVDEKLCHDGRSTTCYFFFKDNAVQDNLETALCALLHQLFDQIPATLRHAMPAWKSNKLNLMREPREMWRILCTAATDEKTGPLICVLDALDECKDEDRRKLIEFLCTIQDKDPSSSTGTIKFLVTSRPYYSVNRWFAQTMSRWPQIRLRGEDKNDEINQEINLVIEQRVDELKEEFSIQQKDCDRIRQQLLSMQHRTYLWLYLAMEEVRDACRDSLYTNEIQFPSLPTSVEDAYERILSRIEEKQKPFARRVLLIILGSRRPLNISEIAFALSAATAKERNETSLGRIDSARLEQQIREQCRLFVFVNHSYVFLIHQTAKEFLLARESGLEVISGPWKYCFQASQVEIEMGLICMTYMEIHHKTLQDLNHTPAEYYDICNGNRSSTAMIVDRHAYDFFEYCADYWSSYLTDDLIKDNESLLQLVMAMYKPSGTVFNWWVSILWWSRFGRHFNPGLPGWYDDWPVHHVLALTGQASILKALIGHEIPRATIDARDSSGRTALRWAAQCGHSGIVETLLQAGASMDLESKSEGTALQVASKSGHEEMVHVLLKYGAAVNTQDLYKSTALHGACSAGHERVVQVLLENGANPCIMDMDGDTPLRIASKKGYTQVMRQLLKGGASIHDLDQENEPALLRASRTADSDLLKIIIDFIGNHRLEMTDFDTALRTASHRGFTQIVQLLLRYDALMCNLGRHDEPALVKASARGDLQLVTLLLQSGADVNQGTSDTLWVAFKSSRGEIKQCLMGEARDIVDAEKPETSQPFFKSTSESADIFTPKRYCDSRLREGLFRFNNYADRREVVDFLHYCESPSDDQRDRRIFENWLEFVSCLNRGRGAEFHSLVEVDNNALSSASWCGHTEVVKCLLKFGVNTSDRHYARAISSASYGAHPDVLKLLLEQNAAAKKLWLEFGRRREKGKYVNVHHMARETGVYFNMDRQFHNSRMWGKQLEDIGSWYSMSPMRYIAGISDKTSDTFGR